MISSKKCESRTIVDNDLLRCGILVPNKTRAWDYPLEVESALRDVVEHLVLQHVNCRCIANKSCANIVLFERVLVIDNNLFLCIRVLKRGWTIDTI